MSSARALVTAPFAPLVSLRTWAGAAYLLLGFVIGLAEFIFLVTGIAVGVGLSVVIVGLPLLLAVLIASRTLAAVDRRLANAMLGAAIEAPPAHRKAEGPLLARLRDLVGASSTWRAVGWLLLRLPLAIVGFTVTVAFAFAAFLLVAEPFAGGLQDAAALPRAASIVGGIALALIGLSVIDGLVAVHRRIARSLLGPSVGEELARAHAETARQELRANLARDLHDSVGHSVTAMVLQASAARRVLDTDTAYVAGALEAIETQGREVMDELDHVLAVLRDEPTAARADVSLDLLDELVARTRAAGLPVTFDRRGDFATVPAHVAREAYRVVQEALTNVLRHASGAATRVTVVADGEMTVVVANDGGGSAAAPGRVGGGRGLVGIGERVSSLGGSFEHGPADGGYRLRAVLPLERP